MTREELDRLLQSLGWFVHVHARRKTGKLYVYAQRRLGKKVVTRYLCPLERLDTLDEATVEQKLQ